ncbi:hypothetical protein, partial [uncultured Faecalibaculum sp.]
IKGRLMDLPFRRVLPPVPSQRLIVPFNLDFSYPISAGEAGASGHRTSENRDGPGAETGRLGHDFASSKEPAANISGKLPETEESNEKKPPVSGGEYVYSGQNRRPANGFG